HDGRPMTVRDVRATFERLLFTRRSEGRFRLSPVVGAQTILAGGGRDLSGFRIVSPREFTIDLEQPMSVFPAFLTDPSIGILPEGTGEIHGEEILKCPGTGPFQIARFVPGERLELVRNPAYWRAGSPKSESLIFRFDVPAKKILEEFRAGTLSIASDLFPDD